MPQSFSSNTFIGCLHLQIYLRLPITPFILIFLLLQSSLDEEYAESQRSFCNRVEEFARGYDLISHGAEGRVQQAKAEIQALQAEQEQYEKGKAS